jgi:hypothetical protein
MATVTLDQQRQAQTATQKTQEVRELFADAPELGRTALENVIHELAEDTASPPRAAERACFS